MQTQTAPTEALVNDPANWRNQPLPRLHDTEYGGKLTGDMHVKFEVTPTDWTHVCPARFGLGRIMEDGSRVNWTGRSHRFDIFKRTIVKEYARGEDVQFTQWALRWSHGGGDGWLVTDSVSWTTDLGSAILLETIAAEPHEERRWAMCHAIYNTASEQCSYGRLRERQRIEKLYLNGDMRKSTRGGQTYVVYK